MSLDIKLLQDPFMNASLLH